MLFNTLDFAKFFCIVLLVYWLVWRWRTVQNVILLAASWYFYNHFHSYIILYLVSLITVSYSSARWMDRIILSILKKYTRLLPVYNDSPVYCFGVSLWLMN